jgi:hypothetical protein
MKRILSALFLLVIIFMLFRLKAPKSQEYLVKINNYTITSQEFNEEFLASAYAQNNTPESKREFLNMLIRRKLVLQDAQARGLDKDKEFLKSIERFWEQSLLKRMMDKKSQEITGTSSIPDSAVEKAYNKLKSQGKADKPLDQMRSQIKWSLNQFQESQALNKWLVMLYRQANIKINPAYVFQQDDENKAIVPAPVKEVGLSKI